MTLNGTMEDFSPAGILRMLSSDGRTGAVRFSGDAGCTVYLHQGHLYFARDDQTDESLATALVRPGRLTADDWARAVNGAGDRPMVGELLVRSGAIDPDMLASVVLSIVYDPLIALFRDGGGDFDFEPDTVHWLGPVRAFPVDAIVAEVRRRVREADEWADVLPSLDAWVDARRTLPGDAAQVTLLREDWELVTALAAPRTIDELAGELGRGRYSTARVVFRLSEAGLVDVVAGTADADVVQLHPDRHDGPLDQWDGIGEIGSDDRAADELTDEAADHHDASGETPNRFGEPAWWKGGTEPDGGPQHPCARDDDVDPFDDGGFFHQPDAPAAHDGFGLFDHDRNGEAEVTDGRADQPDTLPHRDPNASAEADHTPEAAASAVAVAPDKHEHTAWLEDLYAQFIDEPEMANNSKKRRRNDPNPVEVAFSIQEQDKDTKVSTLRRLLGALKKM